MTEPDDIGGEFKHDLRDIIKTKTAKTLDDVINYAQKKGFRQKQNVNLELTKKQERLMGKVVLKYGDKSQKSTLGRLTTMTRREKETKVYRDIVTGRFTKKPEV